MSDDAPESAVVQRGLILVQQGQFHMAREYLLRATAENPHDPRALALLATCQYHIDGEEETALTTVERALALAPLEAEYHALRAWILLALHRPRPALASAAEALQLDPTCVTALTAEASAYVVQENWAAAEGAARRALEIDPENAHAANLLAETLRIQGRREETDAHLAARLARDPLDPRTHTIAGWAALQRGDRAQAEDHFVEALRLDPNLDWARSGLIETFKARSRLYRGYLRWNFAMGRLSVGQRYALLFGLYFGARFLRTVLGRAGIIVAVLYLLFVLWTYLASAIGNFLLLLDRRARLALKDAEEWEGLLVGCTLCNGLLLLVLDALTRLPALREFGLGLVGASIPFALTFTNQSKSGRSLFGAIAVFSLSAGLLACVSTLGGSFIPPAVTRTLGWTAFFLVIATTWLGNVRSLHR